MSKVGLVVVVEGREINIYFNSEEDMRFYAQAFGYNIESLYTIN